jgi:hypothetical protein
MLLLCIVCICTTLVCGMSVELFQVPIWGLPQIALRNFNLKKQNETSNGSGFLYHLLSAHQTGETIPEDSNCTFKQVL